MESKLEGNVGDDLFDMFLNLDGFAVVESSDKGHDNNGRNVINSSESEVESCAMGSVWEGVADRLGFETQSGIQFPPARIPKSCSRGTKSTFDAPAAKLSRHFRSISMDGLIDSVNFCEKSLSDSMDGTFCLEFGSVEFSGTDLKKIMADKRLEEIALADPKRAKRIIANRNSAARSKERKVRYISELESKVQTLQTEATILSTQLAFLQGDSAGLFSQNNELKIRLQSMQQQGQLRDALNEALTAEVHRLRLVMKIMNEVS